MCGIRVDAPLDVEDLLEPQPRRQMLRHLIGPADEISFRQEGVNHSQSTVPEQSPEHGKGIASTTRGTLQPMHVHCTSVFRSSPSSQEAVKLPESNPFR